MAFTNISRIECAEKRMRGYFAQFTIDRKTYKIYFSDRMYGSAELALSAAEAAVAAKYDEHCLYISLKRRHNRRSNSPGDIPGVNRSPRDPQSGTGYWVARWHDQDGRRKSQKFGIVRYGEQQAYELALQLRLRSTEVERDLLRQIRVEVESFSLTRPI